jgi:hypothetical protein
VVEGGVSVLWDSSLPQVIGNCLVPMWPNAEDSERTVL